VDRAAPPTERSLGLVAFTRKGEGDWDWEDLSGGYRRHSTGGNAKPASGTLAVALGRDLFSS